MEKEIRPDNFYNKIMAILILLSVTFIVLSAFFGEIMMPLATGFFAALLFVENKNKVFSVICAIIAVLLTVFLFSPTAIWSSASVLLGIVIYFMYIFGNNKCDTSLLITLLASIVIVVSFILIAFNATGVYTIDSVFAYYEAIYEFIKKEFVSRTIELYSSMPSVNDELIVNEEIITSVIDSFVKTIPSVIAIISFALTGVALKLYTKTLRMILDESNNIYTWNFFIPKIYAYFYIVLYVLSLFLRDGSVISIAAINLSGIFASIFAYMGFKFIYTKMSERGHKALAVILPLFSIIFLGSFAIDLLSVFGVVYTVYSGKEIGTNSNSDENNTNV